MCEMNRLRQLARNAVVSLSVKSTFSGSSGRTSKSIRLASVGNLASLAVILLFSANSFSAQSTTPAPDAAPNPPKTAHPHKRSSAAHPAPDPMPVAEALPPPAPEPPKWPAFDHPGEASVVWDSHGLTIGAANSSLQQILKDVSTATGVRVDGMSADQRVFGNFGPGQARDVLSQLLQGSGYNVIMIGEQSPGAPRRILLSQRRGGSSQPAPRAAAQSTDDSGGGSEDEEPEEPPMPQPEPPQVRPNFQPGAPPRSPQQILQEMQQRQQQQQPQPQE